MAYRNYFGQLPTKLPMKSQTRGKLIRQLEELPNEFSITAAMEMGKQQRIEDIKAILQADWEAIQKQVARQSE